FQRLNAAVQEFAPPKADGVVTHAERFRNTRAGPAAQRQKDGSRPVRLRSVRSPSHRFQRHNLLLRRHNRRLPDHALSLESIRRTDGIRKPLRWIAQSNLLSLRLLLQSDRHKLRRLARKARQSWRFPTGKSVITKRLGESMEGRS